MFIVNVQNRVIVKKIGQGDLEYHWRDYETRLKQVYQGQIGDRW